MNETEGTTVQNGGHKYTKAPIDGSFTNYAFSARAPSNTVELTIDGSVAPAKTTLVNANMLGDGDGQARVIGVIMRRRIHPGRGPSTTFASMTF